MFINFVVRMDIWHQKYLIVNKINLKLIMKNVIYLVQDAYYMNCKYYLFILVLH